MSTNGLRRHRQNNEAWHRDRHLLLPWEWLPVVCWMGILAWLLLFGGSCAGT